MQSRRIRWTTAIQSAAALLFGIGALIWPGPALGVLILLFAIFSVVYGLSAAVDAFAERRENTLWWLQLIAGIAGIIVGLMTFVWPGLTALTLIYLVVSWLLVIGIIEIIEAFRAHRPAEVRWAFGLAGLGSVALAVLLLILRPEVTAVALVWLIGVYAIMVGILWGFRAVRPDARPLPSEVRTGRVGGNLRG